MSAASLEAPRASGSRSRYPGTRPFSDSAEDRSRFFGREAEAEELHLRILSVPLLIQFGKSGLGKTSLLQAGAFPRLRTRPYFPVMVRLNAEHDTLIAAVAGAFNDACKQDDVDLILGNATGLWELLSTTTIWRGDLLLTPVLVFDQFEEVFTLRDAGFRADLAAEIGAVASGVPPERLRASDPPPRPQAKIVISLREDYLGALEELSAAIPGLFQERLRLEPLREEAARDAIVCPAALQSTSGEVLYLSPPFEFESNALEQMIDYLKGSSSVIEPFQLQLLSRHAESIAARKTAKSGRERVTLKGSDFAGAQSFAAVLDNFYRDTIAKIRPASQRNRAADLCQDGLLAGSGHRLMLEEGQIRTDYKVAEKTLELLCDERVLRRERRLDSVFYEISHDRLAESIVEARRVRIPKKVRRRMWAAAIIALAVLVALAIYNRSIGQERERVRKERDSAEQLISFLLGEQFLGEVRDTGRSAMLGLVQHEVEQSGGVANRNAVNRGLALRNTADIQRVQGHLSESRRLYEAALAEFARAPEGDDIAREKARTHYRLADALSDQGHHGDALRHLQAGETAWRRVVARRRDEAQTPQDCIALADTILVTAYTKHRMGEANILPEIDKAFAVASSVLFGAPGPCAASGEAGTPYPEPGAINILTEITLVRSVAYAFGEDSSGAAALAHQAATLRPQSVEMRDDALSALSERASTRLSDEPEAALADYRRILEQTDELRRWDPDNRTWQRDRAITYLLISDAILQCWTRRGENVCPSKPVLSEAEALTLAALDELRSLAAIDSSDLLLANHVMWALQSYASVLREKGERAEALMKLNEAERFYADHPRDPSDVESVILYAVLVRDIGTLEAIDDAAAGLRDLQRSHALLEKALQQHPGNSTLASQMSGSFTARAAVLRAQNDAAAADAAEAQAKDFATMATSVSDDWDHDRETYKRLDHEHYVTGKAANDPATALAELRKSEAAALRYVSLRPAEMGGYQSLRSTYEQMANAFDKQKDVGGAIAAYNASMNAAQFAVWLAPDAAAKNRIVDLLAARTTLALYLNRHKRIDAALGLLQEVVTQAERLTDGPSPDPSYLEFLGTAQCGAGVVRSTQHMAGWEEAIRSGLIRIERASELDPKNAAPLEKAAGWREYLATQLEEAGRGEAGAVERQRAQVLRARIARLAPATPAQSR